MKGSLLRSCSGLPIYATLVYRVDDLADDQAICLRCECRMRAITRSELSTLVGRDERLSGIGLRPELWCRECDEPCWEGWVVSAPALMGSP
jgi:uncharacterized protein with PIN domain